MVALASLVDCQVTHYCRLADADMTALLLAALANPDASAGTRGAAHTLLAGYYAVKMHSLELIAPHISAAVDAEPDRVDFRLGLIRLYLVVDNLVAAGEELDVARKLDRWELHTAELDAERARLELALGTRAK